MYDSDILKSVTIPQLLKRVTELCGNNTAYLHMKSQGWSRLTYRDVGAFSETIARGLLALGLSRNDKIALISENSPEWCLSYFGILSTGATVVPVDPLLKSNEMGNILAHSECEAAFVSFKCLNTLKEATRGGLKVKYIIVLDVDSPGGETLSLNELAEKGKSLAHRLPAVSNLDLAVLIYTSGTTGNPKGVMLTHKNILSDLWGIEQNMKLYAEDRFLSVMPLHHTFEATCGFLIPMSRGAGVIFSRSLKSKELVEDIKNHAITVLLGVPLLYEKIWMGLAKNVEAKSALSRLYFKAGCAFGRMLPKALRFKWGRLCFSFLRGKAGLDSLRLLVCGGAPLPFEIARNFDLLGIKFLQGYGLTETSPVLTINPEKGYRYSSIGIPIKGAELKINRPDQEGIGEILAKGDMVMSGYYRNPDETVKVLKDGWLYTGDSGWKDQDGFYYISGRIKNVIVTRAGKNVYPEEIEKELTKSPFILEAAVVGRRIAGGEDVYAIIVPDSEQLAQSGQSDLIANEQKLYQLIKTEVAKACEHLADYKRVKGFDMRQEEFEKTSSRKVKRHLLSQNQAPSGKAAAKPQDTKEVKV